MHSISNNKILASIDNEICLLTPPSMAKQVLLTLPSAVYSLIPIPHFNIDTSPYVIYLCENSLGIADLKKKEYKNVDHNEISDCNGDGNGEESDKDYNICVSFNSTSKLQLVEVAADGSILLATTRDYKKVATFRIRW